MRYIKAKEIPKGVYKVTLGEVKFNMEKEYLSIGFLLDSETTVTKYFSTTADQYKTEDKLWKDYENLYKQFGLVWNAALRDLRDVAVELETQVSKKTNLQCLLLVDEYNGNAYVKPYSLRSESWLLEKFEKPVIVYQPMQSDTTAPAQPAPEKKSSLYFDETEQVPF